MSKNFRYNSEWMPEQFPHHFDAHIYFESHQLTDINSLKAAIINEFGIGEFKNQYHIGDIIDVPIGPHPFPMLEVNFSKQQFGNFVPWLSLNRGVLSVLIHPQTGDDYYDHTQGAIWLGKPAPIKLHLFK